VICVLATAAALGVGTSLTTASAADELTFTVGITNEVDSFNPFNGIEAESYEMWALMYDYMITYSDKDMSPQPGLAESWDTSDDGLTWTFHIRTGVKWSDGEDLTAQDIAYTYNRVLDGGPEAASWGSYLGSVTEITAPDDETVVLQLDAVNAVLPLLPIPIVPEHIWKDVPEDEVKSYPNEPESEEEPVVGSGPFRLISGKAGGPTYRFVVNPDYWQGESKITDLNFELYLTEDTLVQALNAGEIDFAEGVSALQVKNLDGQDGITAQLGDSPSFDEIAFNVGSDSFDTSIEGVPKSVKQVGDPNPAVKDQAFRYALNWAINREQLIQAAYQGAGDPGKTIIPPAYSQYAWVPDDPDAFSYDPEKTKQLLDEAGYTVGSDGFRTMPDGSPIGKLRLFARSDSEISLSTMKFLQAWLKDVNIDSKVTAVESNRLTNIILDGEYDIFQWGWYVEPSPDSMLSYFTCGQLGNWSDSWMCDPAYDALYKQQQVETDPTKRQEIVKQMQEMLFEEMPYIVTAYSAIGEAYRSDRWEGFVPQPNPGGVLLFQYGIANYLNLQPAGTAEGVANPGGIGAGSTSSAGLSGAQIIGIGIAGIVLFIGGGFIGGVAGYRKATVDYRE
jgi:peptide/nickel transport system substrate-binding protein